MSNFQQKPKRKNGLRNPYVMLGAGIVIGILIMGVFITLFLLFAGNKLQSQSLPGVPPTASPIPVMGTNLPAVPPPVGAQAVQETPIANRLQAAAISSNGTHLAYVSVENAVSHIYLNELRVEANLTGNQYELYQSPGYFNDVVFSPDGSKLIATIDSGVAILFDVTTRTIIEEYAQIEGAAFTRDSKRLVLVGSNNGIRVLDVQGNSPILVDSRSNNQQNYAVGAVALSSSDGLAIAFDTRIETFDLDNLAAAPQIIEPENGFVSDLAFHPTESNRLAAAMAGADIQFGTVQVYDLNNSSRSQFNFGTRVFAIAFSPDGEWLAVGGGESGYAETKLIAYRWDSTNNPIPADPNYYQPITFEGHEHTIFDVAFTREGYLLSTGWDGSVRLWDLFSPGDELSVYYP